MKHYIDTNNKLWGFDETQTALIPKDAIEIPSTYTFEQYIYIYLRLVNGVVCLDTLAYNNNLWEQIRFQRDQLLKESDWITVTDANPKPSKQAWLDYRQALRDIPKNFTNPIDVIWPQEPA